jgi:hypothetical protein
MFKRILIAIGTFILKNAKIRVTVITDDVRVQIKFGEAEILDKTIDILGNGIGESA